MPGPEFPPYQNFPPRSAVDPLLVTPHIVQCSKLPRCLFPPGGMPHEKVVRHH